MIENAFDFEKIIQMKFKRTRYDVTPNENDNEPGYDFVAEKGKSKFAVQVKNYKKPVNAKTVHNFKEFLDKSIFSRGILISSKGFSTPALSSILAEKPKNLYLGHIDEELNKIIWSYPEGGIPTDKIEQIKGEQARQENKVHVISIFTAKGGVGKTTVAAHLAGALALCGYKTRIIDGDPEQNLYRITGKTAKAFNPRTGKHNNIDVLTDISSEEQTTNHIFDVFDCSPVFEKNNGGLIKRTKNFIIPTSLSPLEIGNNAEVLLRSIKEIRYKNTTANIFMLLNKYSPMSRSELSRFQHVQRIFEENCDRKVNFIDPKDASIRESKLLKNWGIEPDLSFKMFGGRCYPRDDFLNLADYLLEHIEINK